MPIMRLDKFLSDTGRFTRSEGKAAIRKGRIAVNGQIEKSPERKLTPETDTVTLDGAPLLYRRYTYLMLNKPEGVVSATEDGDKTVIDLLPEELRRIGLFPCGRLDKSTVGLVLLMNDGPLSHRLLAPKSHVDKIYFFRCKFPLSEADIASLEAGVDIGGYLTAPCKVERIGEREGRITLREGKYHQIKLMLAAVHNQITFLERVSFGGIPLDPALGRGEWRYLTEEEETLLKE